MLVERNGDGRIDWSPWIRTFITSTISVVVVLCGAFFTVAERLETPDRKQHRIDVSLNPIVVQITELERQHRGFEKDIRTLEDRTDDLRSQNSSISAQMVVVQEAILEIRADIKTLLRQTNGGKNVD